MGSNISSEDRKRMEQFIAEHPPYQEDDPEVNFFDGSPVAEPERVISRMYQLLLEGKLDRKKQDMADTDGQ